MKKILIVNSLFLFTSPLLAAANGFVGSYYCSAEGKSVRQQGGSTVPVNAKFYLKKYKNEQGKFYLSNVVGHIAVDGNSEGQLSFDNSYYSVFSIKQINENPDYKPRKYVGFSQYPNFSETASNTYDGGGMNGEFIFPKETPAIADGIKAYYIFQSGDHMGGTLDLTCSTR